MAEKERKTEVACADPDTKALVEGALKDTQKKGKGKDTNNLIKDFKRRQEALKFDIGELDKKRMEVIKQIEALQQEAIKIVDAMKDKVGRHNELGEIINDWEKPEIEEKIEEIKKEK